MAKIVLISCTKDKKNFKTKAVDLYSASILFRTSLEYAKIFNPDKMFILSAKYGLLSLEAEIEPYEETLKGKKLAIKENWANKVIHQLKQEIDLNTDEVTFLAGKDYCNKFLLSHIKNYKEPLEGLSYGKRIQFMKGMIK